MARAISGFKTEDGRRAYLALYDRFLAESWPVERTELDVGTTYGSTPVGVSGGGDRPPLFMIHPTSGSSLGWHRIVGRLCQDRTVYTPDTIGTIGRSVQTAPIGEAADLVRWLDEVIDGLGVSELDLLGYSEGGWVAGLHAASTDRRRRLRSLVLIEPAGAIERVPGRTLVEMVARGARTLVARDKAAAIREFNRWMNGDVDLTDGEVELVLAAFGSFRQKLPRPERLADDELGRLGTPTLLLLAADTILYDPVAAAERAKRLMADVRVEVKPDAGHGVPMQYPDEVADDILAFLDR